MMTDDWHGRNLYCAQCKSKKIGFSDYKISPGETSDDGTINLGIELTLQCVRCSSTDIIEIDGSVTVTFIIDQPTIH